MGIILGILFSIGIVYGVIGIIMAFYEMSQSDDAFDPKTILTWLPKMLKG